jgi:hypothetical protein
MSEAPPAPVNAESEQRRVRRRQGRLSLDQVAAEVTGLLVRRGAGEAARLRAVPGTGDPFRWAVTGAILRP